MLPLLAVTAGLCLHVALVKSPPPYDVFVGAARDVLSGANPYAADPRQDFFKYSPLAGLLLVPLEPLPSAAGIFLFVGLQCLLFYWAFDRWSRTAGYDLSRSRRLTLVALGSVALDLTVSIQNAQVNVGIFALMLLGAAQFAESKPVRSGLVLSFATNLKLFPFTFGLCLLARFDRRFWGAFFGGTLLWLLAPALVLGPSRGLELHRQWLELLQWDSGRAASMLDLGSFLELHFGIGAGTRTPLAVVAGAAIGAATFLAFRRGEVALVDRFLLPVNGLYILLFSYLSESPTSILATAGIFLIGASAVETQSRQARWHWLAWGLAIALVGLGYSDLVPAAARAWARASHLKTVGYLYVLGVNLELARRYCASTHVGHSDSERGPPPQCRTRWCRALAVGGRPRQLGPSGSRGEFAYRANGR